MYALDGHQRFCVSLALGNHAVPLTEDTSIDIGMLLEDQKKDYGGAAISSTGPVTQEMRAVALPTDKNSASVLPAKLVTKALETWDFLSHFTAFVDDSSVFQARHGHSELDMS